jgi:Cellulase (glycosyl hydrolase family 5)
MPPIRIHPQNSKIFEFRGQPLVLLTATEHYGAVINRPFDIKRYLADAADKKITLTRLFMLFRELQTTINPYSTCKPETQDFVAPFVRTGPGRARDMELKYDLDQPNPEFFERLHQFLSIASDYGVIVEVVLLSNAYAEHVWELNPLHPANNINSLPQIPWYDTMSRRHAALFERQAAHVRRIVTETNKYDNIIYEICNEPGGNFNAESPSCAEVDKWLEALIGVVCDAEKNLPNKHLIAGQQAFAYIPWEQHMQKTFQDMPYDIVNVHPLPNTTYGGKSFALGQFMSKQLGLRALRDFGLATYAEPKPMNQDEDNIASQYKDYDGWTIHRKRAWVTLLTGGHYDYIDFSIHPHLETGTPASQAHIRSWMKVLSQFVHSFDLVNARPLPGFVAQYPEFTPPIAFGVAGSDYAIYLPDERELTAARDLEDTTLVSPDAGSTISGIIVVNLPPGDYQVACYDPQTGVYSPSIPLAGGPNATVHLPEFRHDIAVRIRRR